MAGVTHHTGLPLGTPQALRPTSPLPQSLPPTGGPDHQVRRSPTPPSQTPVSSQHQPTRALSLIDCAVSTPRT